MQQLDGQTINLLWKELQIDRTVWVLKVEDVEIMVAVEAAVVGGDEDVAGNEGFETTSFELPSPLWLNIGKLIIVTIA